jgi:hypothetical protein
VAVQQEQEAYFGPGCLWLPSANAERPAMQLADGCRVLAWQMPRRIQVTDTTSNLSQGAQLLRRRRGLGEHFRTQPKP